MKEHRWFGISLLTAVFLTIAAGAWLWLNAVENDQYWGYEASAYTHHGFPSDAVITYDYKDMFIDDDKRVKFGFETQTIDSMDGDRFCCDIVTPYKSAVLIPSGIAVDVLLGFGLLIAAVLFSKLLSHCRKRGWLKFHLSTAVLLMLVSGVILGVNMRPDKLGFYYGFPRLAVSPYVLDTEVAEGYPDVDDEEPFPFNFKIPILDLHVILTPFLENALFAGAVLTTTAFISEFTIRRRAKKRNVMQTTETIPGMLYVEA